MKLGVYAHYKTGDEYRVHAVAKREATHEQVVVYEALYGDHQWYTRPVEEFEQDVTWNGEVIKRFTYVR